MTSAHELTKTHYCKAAGCENEARSPVGRYSYCDEHQHSRPEPAPRAAGGTDKAGTEGALRGLLKLAARVDKAKSKAEKAQQVANAAAKAADALAGEYKDALAEAARG